MLEDCYRRFNEAASENTLSSHQCSDCHYCNHTVPSCQIEKCESVFFCGELTRHPDKKMKLQEQKNKIKALETSVTKLEQDLRSREAAFDRVHGSVNKLVEDMLLEEYPEEYVQNNSRKWLKIQQDIAFVKKSLQGNGPPRREIVKSLLETKSKSPLKTASASQLEFFQNATPPRIPLLPEVFLYQSNGIGEGKPLIQAFENLTLSRLIDIEKTSNLMREITYQSPSLVPTVHSSYLL